MKRIFLAGLLCAGMALAFARANQNADLDPLRVAADTHKLALENKFVRVLDVNLPPGKIEPMHSHPHGLSVYFSDWEAKVTVQGGKPEVHPRKAGTFAWSEALTHTVQNVSKNEAHILRVELKF